MSDIGKLLKTGLLAALIAAGLSSPAAAATQAGGAIAPVVPAPAETLAPPDAVEPDAWVKPAPQPPAQKPLVKITLPANGYGTDKLGDDLLVHAPEGDYAKHDFLKGQKPGELRPFAFITSDHGECMTQVNANGETVSMMCEK